LLTALALSVIPANRQFVLPAQAGIQPVLSVIPNLIWNPVPLKAKKNCTWRRHTGHSPARGNPFRCRWARRIVN